MCTAYVINSPPIIKNVKNCLSRWKRVQSISAEDWTCLNPQLNKNQHQRTQQKKEKSSSWEAERHSNNLIWVHLIKYIIILSVISILSLPFKFSNQICVWFSHLTQTCNNFHCPPFKFSFRFEPLIYVFPLQNVR